MEGEDVPEEEIERCCSALQKLWEDATGSVTSRAPTKLDKALDMRRQEHLSKKQTLTQVVDIASVVGSPFAAAGYSKQCSVTYLTLLCCTEPS